MKNENLKKSSALKLKKQKVISLSFGTINNLCGGEATHGTTSAGATNTTGDADAIMIAYITM